jgi:hypothetical protein
MDSDNDENLNTKDKTKVKTCKKFSISLIRQSVISGWEDHEIANLLVLVSKELDLDNLKLLKLIQKCNVCNPIVLQCLVDSDISFSASQIITAMFDQTDDTDSFIKAIGVSFEQGLLNGTDDETLEAVSVIIFIYIYMCVYIYAYMYTYIHLYTYIHMCCWMELKMRL